MLCVYVCVCVCVCVCVRQLPVEVYRIRRACIEIPACVIQVVCVYVYMYVCIYMYVCVWQLPMEVRRECIAIRLVLLFKLCTVYVVCLQDLKRAQVLIFANKQDLKGSMSAAELSQHLNLTSIKDHGWHVQPCCALTGEG